MTDCGNAEIRDLLPDLAADQLSASESARLQAHVDGCRECADELAVLRVVRAVRPRAVAVDIAKIVASLPKPSDVVTTVDTHDTRVVSLSAHRDAKVATSRGARGLWRMAATIGIIIAGGWSVVMVQSGGLGMMRLSDADSLRLSAAVQGVDTGTRIAASDAPPADANGSAVSFGNLGDYTEEELQRVLDRLEQWDGATSTESVTTTPILPVAREGAGD